MRVHRLAPIGHRGYRVVDRAVRVGEERGRPHRMRANSRRAFEREAGKHGLAEVDRLGAGRQIHRSVFAGHALPMSRKTRALTASTATVSRSRPSE